jgi:hypothetical protein
LHQPDGIFVAGAARIGNAPALDFMPLIDRETTLRLPASIASSISYSPFHSIVL